MKKLVAAIALLSFALLSPVKAFSAEPQMVELNKATMEDLVKIKGIGKKRAQAILNLKKEVGTFSSLNQLSKVKGVGKKTLGHLACTLYVEAEGKGKIPCLQPEVKAAKAPEVVPVEKRINVNKATVAELDKVKGIGKKLAQKIVDYRTANGPFKTLDDLTKIRGIGKKSLETLKGYLKAE